MAQAACDGSDQVAGVVAGAEGRTLDACPKACGGNQGALGKPCPAGQRTRKTGRRKGVCGGFGCGLLLLDFGSLTALHGVNLVATVM